MAFYVMADNGVSIPATRDGAMYHAFAGGDFIIANIGTEFATTYNESSLILSTGTGEAVIGGRHITSDEDNEITLGASATYYICLRVDLSQTAGNEGMLVALTSEELLEQENLNNGGLVRDLLLGVATTSTTGVASYTDKRTILTSAQASSSEVAISTSWTDDTATSGYYTQTIAFNCTASDVLQFGLKKTFALATDETLETEFAKIKIIDTQEGSLMVYATEATTTTITLIVKGA